MSIGVGESARCIEVVTLMESACVCCICKPQGPEKKLQNHSGRHTFSKEG